MLNTPAYPIRPILLVRLGLNTEINIIRLDECIRCEEAVLPR